MPVIPGGNPQQVLNPGSPVNAVSSEEERMLGNAIQGFGKSLNNLGIAEKEKQKRDTISEITVQNEFRKYIDEEKAVTTVNPIIQDDYTGQKQVGGFRERVQQKMNDYFDNNPIDPEVKRGAISRIGGDINSAAEFLGAHELKKIADVNEASKKQIAANLSSQLAITPYKADEKLAELEILVRKAPKDPSRVNEEISAMGKDLVSGAVNEIINSKNPDFDSARTLVDNNAKNYYTNEERDKIRSDINNAEYQFYQRGKAKYEYSRTVGIRELEDKQNRNFDMLSQERDRIGNDEKQLSSFSNFLLAQKSARNITDGQYDQLMKQPDKYKIKDNMIGYDITNDYITKGKVEEGNAQVNKLKNAGEISSAKATQLLEQLKSADKLNPDAKTALGSAVRQITTLSKADPIFSGMQVGLMDDTKYRNVVASVATEFTVWALKNKDKWPVFGVKANEMIRNKMRAETYVPGAQNQKQFGSPEAVEAEITRLAGNAIADKKAGKSVDAKKLDSVIKGLRKQQEALEGSKLLKSQEQKTNKNVQSGEL